MTFFLLTPKLRNLFCLAEKWQITLSKKKVTAILDNDVMKASGTWRQQRDVLFSLQHVMPKIFNWVAYIVKGACCVLPFLILLLVLALRSSPSLQTYNQVTCSGRHFRLRLQLLSRCRVQFSVQFFILLASRCSLENR